MSSVELTRPNTDCVNVEIMQDAKNEAICRFKLPFLLPKTDYVVGVTSLTIPIMNTRLIGPAYPELFYIKRRNVGQDIGNAGHTYTDGQGVIGGNIIGTGRLDALENDDPAQGVVAGSTLDVMRHDLIATFSTIQGNALLNISDFLMRLNIFGAAFRNSIDKVGIDPRFYGGPSNDGPIPTLAEGFESLATLQAQNRPPRVPKPMIDFGVTPSGFLIITLQPIFSNHFFLEISPMGQALLGLDTDRIAITQNQATGVITQFGEGLTSGIPGPDENTIRAATVSQAVTLYGNKSLLQTLESRVSIHVETDLPILKTIVTTNGQESHAYDLASFVLENESSSRIKIDGLTVQNNVEFITPTRCGQLVLQSRNENPTQWSPLLSVDELLLFRVRLYLKTREYNPILKKWIFQKKEFPIEQERWTMGLRFVSME